MDDSLVDLFLLSILYDIKLEELGKQLEQKIPADMPLAIRSIVKACIASIPFSMMKLHLERCDECKAHWNAIKDCMRNRLTIKNIQSNGD